MIFLSFHCAIAYDNAKRQPIVKEYQNNDGEITRSEKFNIKLFFKEFTTRISENPKEIYFTDSTIKFVLGSIFLSFIVIAYLITSKKKYISGKEYGSATWGNIKTILHLSAKNVKRDFIREIKNNKSLSNSDKEARLQKVNEEINEDSEMILSASERICIHNRELNNNTLVIGGSGSGKTRGIVMPNLLQGHSSFVITDPKGEILSKSGCFFKKKGYKISVLNLFEMDKSNYYNPFQYIDPKRSDFEENVLTLIDTIIVNTDGGEKKGSSDPFWDKAEKLFLQSIFFLVATAFPKEERNMKTVMELIRMLKIEEEGDNKDSDLDIMFKLYEEKYGSDNVAVLQYKEFRTKAAGKTAKSIVISAVARLAPYNLANVQNISLTDNMNLDKIGEEKTALFIIMPPTNDTFSFIAGMLFTQLFQELNYSANSLHGGHLPVPVRFIMDEFANTCKVPNFVKILAYARSLGIGIMPILQSLEQIKGMYKDEWQVILDNCNTVVFLGGVRNMETLEYISKLLGKGTFDKKNYSRTKGRQSSTSTSFDKIGRELMDPAEIQKMKKNKSIVFISGYSPFFSDKFNYKKHKNYKFTSDYNKENTYIFKGDIEDNENSANCNIEYDEVKVDFDVESNMKYLEEELLNLDFEDIELSDAYYDVKDYEAEDIFNSIAQSKAELSTDVEETIIDFNNNKESVDFNYYYLEYEDNDKLEIEDDLDEELDLDEILTSAFTLKDDLEQLNNLKDTLKSIDDDEIENLNNILKD